VGQVTGRTGTFGGEVWGRRKGGQEHLSSEEWGRRQEDRSI
jgi:hypothetical protein